MRFAAAVWAKAARRKDQSLTFRAYFSTKAISLFSRSPQNRNRHNSTSLLVFDAGGLCATPASSFTVLYGCSIATLICVPDVSLADSTYHFLSPWPRDKRLIAFDSSNFHDIRHSTSTALNESFWQSSLTPKSSHQPILHVTNKEILRMQNSHAQDFAKKFSAHYAPKM